MGVPKLTRSKTVGLASLGRCELQGSNPEMFP